MFKKGRLKTTLAGLGSIFGGVALLVSGQLTEGVTTIIAGIGLVAAKDAEHDSAK